MDFSLSLLQSSMALTALGVEIDVHQCRSSCFVDLSRNTLVAEFMKTDCTHFMMIDDDMGWPADVIPKMLAHDKEFIAGVGPKKVDAGNEFCCNINVNADETPVVENGLISASKVGGAFVILKREGIQRMIDKRPDLVCKAIDKEFGYRFFEMQYTENKIVTEDYNFCDRFIGAGGEVWIYPDISFIHTGVKDYKGNYHQFLLAPNPVAATIETGFKHSIIIVAYKAKETLEDCLRSVARNAPANSELIIVDNTPEPIDINSVLLGILGKAFKSAQLVQHGQNVGFAEACNIGARMATGKNLIFLNPDTVVYPGWADSMAAQVSEGVGAVGPISNFVCGLQNWICFEHSESWAKKEEELTYVGYIIAAQQIAKVKTKKGQDTKLLIGFCLLVPRVVWDKVGEFDPELILGCDDLDYSLRLQRAGYKLKIAPDVFVYHKGHESFYAEGSAAQEMNLKSEIVMRKKLSALYPDGVPSSTELWGCEILPTQAFEVTA